MAIGNMIRFHRERQNIKAKVLAFEVNRHRTTISSWESGVCFPKPVEIEIICKILKVTPNDLFDWEETKDKKILNKIEAMILKGDVL